MEESIAVGRDTVMPDGDQEAYVKTSQNEYDNKTALPESSDLTLGVKVECILLQNTRDSPPRPDSVKGAHLGSKMVHAARSRPKFIRGPDPWCT